VVAGLTGLPRAPVRCFVDNKSLVDAVYSSKRVEDRRLRLDIAVVVDMVEKGDLDRVVWLDTSRQLANALTKRGASPYKLRAAVSGEQ